MQSTHHLVLQREVRGQTGKERQQAIAKVFRGLRHRQRRHFFTTETPEEI